MTMYEVFYKIRILSRDIYAHFPVPSPKFYILPGEEDSPYLIKMQINGRSAIAGLNIDF